MKFRMVKMASFQSLKSLKNLRNTAEFKPMKRKFLITLLGSLGVIPFFQFFKQAQYKNAYFFCASIIDRNLSGEFKNVGGGYVVTKYIGKREQSVFQSLNDRMLSQKKLLINYSISLGNKMSFFYVFDSEKSFLEWGEKVENGLFSTNKLPNHLQYLQKKGFLFKT